MTTHVPVMMRFLRKEAGMLFGAVTTQVHDSLVVHVRVLLRAHTDTRAHCSPVQKLIFILVRLLVRERTEAKNKRTELMMRSQLHSD